MAGRDREIISKIKEAIPLAEFVSETVQLRRSGKYLTGLSPFTKEKTPSFFVNEERQTFHCYSSDQGGDLIDYVMLTRGFSFPEALAFLAQRAGIVLEASNRTPQQIAEDRRIEEERKLFLKLNQFAARFYQEQLEGPGGALARDYMAKRGIEKESELAFAIGFAPDSWTALRDYFLKIKAPLLKAHGLGLFRTKGNEKPKPDGSNLFDTFRNRLIFPIRDVNGEVLGFGGRWLGPSTAEAPKYLNSPESLVYEKDKVLYNLDQARKPIRDLESVVLVEGYMDCLALVQAGFPNVVANCGTALTKTQAHLLKKMAPKVICLYDSDAAGQAASERAMNLFLESEGFPLLGARLPDGKDPDEFLRAHGDEGKIQMAEILQNSPALLDIWIEQQTAQAPNSLQGRTDSLNKIAEKLSKLRDELWIQARIPGVASGLSLTPELVAEAVRKHRKGYVGPVAAPGTAGRRGGQAGMEGLVQAKTAPNSRGKSQEFMFRGGGKSKQIHVAGGKKDIGFDRRFLGDLLKHPNWITDLRARHGTDPNLVLPFVMDAEIRSALAVFLEPLAPGECEEDRIREVVESAREKPQLRNILSEAIVRTEETLPDTELDAALGRLKIEAMRRQAVDLQKQIDEAEKRGDAEASGKLLQQLIELRKQSAQR